MVLKKEQKEAVCEVIKKCLRKKFKNYKPETTHMPFHTHLLGKDRMALFRFIQSLNTTFGTSIFEPVAVEIAKNRFEVVKKQYTIGDKISGDAQRAIQQIIDDLETSGKPDHKKEIERLQQVCDSGNTIVVKKTKVDLYLKNNKGLFLFDLKTAKPNKSAFKDFKRTLLEWSAMALYENPKIKVSTMISIPYNPYAPAKYQRWTLAGMLDVKYELKVAEEFWDFLGGAGTYESLLQCFDEAGQVMKDEIDQYFVKFK